MKTTLRLIAATLVLAAFNLSAATLYVSLDSPDPSPPYTNWATAAHVIQDAVDAARDGDTVWVTNGVYSGGSRDVISSRGDDGWVMTNSTRVVVTNSIRLESVNGPLLTTIMGSKLRNEVGRVTNGIRCAFLGTNAVVSGFTLTSGFAESGGGVWGGVLNNCTLTDNDAWSGGGAYGGRLYSCTVTGNSASGQGGAGRILARSIIVL
jgi:hypothetical protein